MPQCTTRMQAPTEILMLIDNVDRLTVTENKRPQPIHTCEVLIEGTVFNRYHTHCQLTIIEHVGYRPTSFLVSCVAGKRTATNFQTLSWPLVPNAASKAACSVSFEQAIFNSGFCDHAQAKATGIELGLVYRETASLNSSHPLHFADPEARSICRV